MDCKAALIDWFCSIVWKIFWKNYPLPPPPPVHIREESLHIERSILKQFDMASFAFDVVDKNSSSLVSCNCLAAASYIVHLQLIALDNFV